MRIMVCVYSLYREQQLDCKYSELNADSVSDSSFEKEDLSIQYTSKKKNNDVTMT